MRAVGYACSAAVLAALVLVGPPAGAAVVDVAAVRTATGPAVCRVTVENAWGVPLVMASGFLLGDGRFVVTDLGAVARPGVDRVTLQFQDGPPVTVREFGMADPVLGLVLLRLPADAPKRSGLLLATGLPSQEGNVTVMVAGWQWGRSFEVAVGRLCRGPGIKEVAALTRVETQSGIDAFVRMEGGRLDGAAGSPLLDSAGTVLAVNLDVPIRNTVATLAMPATSLRSALMVAAPQLKALSELPKPLWPVKSLRIPGNPVTSQEFLNAVSRFKTALTCRRCGGRGKIASSGGGHYGYGYSDYYIPCSACGGETVAFKDEGLKLLEGLVEQGTCTLWVPAMEEKARANVRAVALETLTTLAGYGRRFQGDVASAVGSELGKRDAAFPMGIILKARVLKPRETPDGRYIFFAPQRGNTTFLARAEDLAPPAGRGSPVRNEPIEGTWILLAGTVLARCTTDSGQGLFVLPMEWMPIGAPPPLPPPPPEKPPRPRGH
ncbi:MAG: serine protease [Planctomycetota bacterium]|nr:serine protease [Planctomycetota bacterium]